LAFSVQTKAIGYAGVFDAMKAARAGRVKILALKKDNESQAVAPSQETVKNGTYPLVIQLYYY
jgi:ABC-type phosphate transport system substrate-binding protein